MSTPRASPWPLRASLALLALALAALLGRAPHSLDLLGVIQPQIAGLCGLAALVLLLRRRFVPALIAGIACLAALAGMEELRRGWPEAGPGEAREITFATANVFHANPDLPALAQALAAIGADVLVTQETPAALLAAPGPLGALYPHRASWTSPSGKGGPAIWSRLPLAAAEGERAGGHPNHLIASIDIGAAQPLQVMALHFDWPLTGGQDWQVEDFHRFYAFLKPPLVVAGDFNAAPWSATVRRVERITRTEVLPGWRPSYYGGSTGRLGWLRLPFGLPIDQVLVSPGIGAEGAETVALPGADHRAVVVRLTVAGPPPGG